ncbi:MAG: pyridoxal phosphate-dependent aminotransferase [Alphaproteobacteria bacterium]|nr:pyridoxal phosphate-dependent aminotransferase [Alphaproteobacteria bacterium]
MRFSPLVDRIAGEQTGAWRVHAEGMRRREAGHDVIFLTVGDPDQAAPAAVVYATIEALRRNRTGYTPIIGYPQVREAVAARMQRRSGRPCSADNVVLTPGTQGGLFCALNCLAGPGDEVILPEPIYGPYAGVVGASGARMVNVPLRPENGFHPDLGSLARAVTPRTRVIWINTPHNPTGAVFTADEVTGIARLCRERDLWLVSDEVYEDLAFARPHTSAWSLPDMADRTIVASSLSKSHAMAGFRFGWVIGPPTLSRHLFDFLLCMYFGGPAFIQDGALAALGGELPEVGAQRETYRRRALVLTDILEDAPNCRAIPPEGGMFVLLDIRGTGLGAEDFGRQLLLREDVALVPCDGFGPSAAGHLRIALTAPEPRLEEAGRRIVRFARSLM